ncbi:ABC transporter permease [Actinomyces wuliandei]|uniref:ABC transporter permease n=1 Tax=Actinomyces wuliandei TaxID=2057743 RepID=UPI00111ACB3F|nr:ABC transporter permease [Actinomyces wuliandei]
MSTTTLKNPIYLALVQAKFQLSEAVRIPISILMGLFAPSIGLLFFVVPQRAVAEDSELATSAVIGLAVFGVMVNSLFQFATEVSQARERPWGTYTRTLPCGAGSRLLSYILSSGVLSAASVIPLILLAAFSTEASLTLPRLLAGIAALLVTSAPSMLIGIAIGYLLGSKAAVAVAQVLMLALAFGGGLFIPPHAFPEQFATVSLAMPTRSALELSSWATGVGTEHFAPALVGFFTWTIGLTVICLIRASRDSDREYDS